MNLSPENVLQQLERILGSTVFAGAARQQRLLRHLVTKKLDGDVTELKEYTLGLTVFDRGEDFDPRLDPIVRVEASRLRSRLQKYYEHGQAAAELRIELPRGAYVPTFSEPTPVIQAPAVVDQPAPAVPAKRPRPALWWIAPLAVLGAAAVWLILSRSHPAPAPHYLNFQRITNEEEVSTWPTWSPDGRQLGYARRQDGIWHIFERDMSSGAYTDLTPGAEDDDRQPAWSPDGRTISFRSEANGGGLFLLDVGSRAIKRLTQSGFSPSWSPDSTNLVFSTGTFDDPVEVSPYASGGLRIVNVRTGAERGLTPRGVMAAMQPAWSPHGQRIAYWDTSADGARNIWTIAADGSGSPLRLTQDDWTDWSPAWARDGRYLYFSSDRGGAMNLWRIRIDESSGKAEGSPEPVTTPSSYSAWVAFAPSGDKFAFGRRTVLSELYSAPFDAAKGVHFDRKIALTGGEHSLHEPGISPDGKWIVVRIQDPREDLALISTDGKRFVRLTNDIATDRSPEWSPDGKEIVFRSNRSGSDQLWAIRPDGTGLRQLTANGVVAYAWTPTGVLAAYPENAPPYAIDPPGKPIADFGAPPVLRPLAWSPNGESVVGRMRAPGFAERSLFIYTVPSHDYWEISNAAPYPSALWLKDGYELLYTGLDGIYLADVHKHTTRLAGSTAHLGVRWRFTLSPDDSKIYFVESDDRQDLWLASR